MRALGEDDDDDDDDDDEEVEVEDERTLAAFTVDAASASSDRSHSRARPSPTHNLYIHFINPSSRASRTRPRRRRFLNSRHPARSTRDDDEDARHTPPRDSARVSSTVRNARREITFANSRARARARLARRPAARIHRAPPWRSAACDANVPERRRDRRARGDARGDDEGWMLILISSTTASSRSRRSIPRAKAEMKTSGRRSGWKAVGTRRGDARDDVRDVRAVRDASVAYTSSFASVLNPEPGIVVSARAGCASRQGGGVARAERLRARHDGDDGAARGGGGGKRGGGEGLVGTRCQGGREG